MASPEICVLDYGFGNVRSAVRAVEEAGGKPILTADQATRLCEEAKDRFYSAASIFKRSLSGANTGSLGSALVYFGANYMTRKEVKGKENSIWDSRMHQSSV